MSLKYIVLGAGLSGLSCALALKRAGNEVIVLEKESEVGGLARCFRINGLTFDYGPHFLFGYKVIPLLQRITPGLGLKDIKRNFERIYLRDKYFKFPFDPKNLFFNMEYSRIPSVLFEIFYNKIAKRNQKEKNKNVESWIVNSSGKHVYEYISLSDYIQKLYGLDPKRVSVDWGFQKLKFMSRWRDVGLLQLAKKALIEEERLKKITVTYPPLGIDAIASTLSDEFQGIGGELSCDIEPVSISIAHSGVSVISQTQGSEKEIKGDFLISTIPIVDLFRLINLPQQRQVREKIKGLRYRVLLLLFLFFDAKQVFDFVSLYFTEPSFFFILITNFKKLDSKMVPEDKSSLCIEITCFENDAIDNKSPEDIFTITVNQLKNKGFINPKFIQSYHYMKVPNAYPVYEIGYMDLLKKYFDVLAQYNNIISIGRQGLFFYNTMSNSILSAYALGQKLAAGKSDDLRFIIKETYKEREILHQSKN